MINRIAVSAAMCLAATLAQAADLPPAPAPAYKEPVVVLPAFTWTGLYLGGELGWIRTNPKFTPGAVVLGAPFVATSLPVNDKQGLSYGFLAGYNYQIGQTVVGFEGDFTGWTVGTVRSTEITGDFITAQSKWGGSLRGRLGYAVDHALFYVTAGAALASTKTAATGTGYSIGGDDIRWGWVVGAGLDYAFTDHWFTGLAYRYTQYESKIVTYPLGAQNLGIVGFKHEQSDQRVAVRIGYKF